MNRSIITVVGKDTVGIIARVCTYLSEDFHQVSSDLEALGANIGVQIKCQREDIFEKMHRI